MHKEIVVFVPKNGTYRIKSNSNEVELIGNIKKIKTLIVNKYTKKIIGYFNIETLILDEDTESIEIFGYISDSNLKSIVFNNKLKIIKDRSFYKCTNLKEITLPNDLECIDYRVFDECSNLETINFNSKLEIIDYRAFADCVSIKNLDFSKLNNLTNINDQAFLRCESLEEITFNNFPYISDSAFIYCPNIKTINLNINEKNKVITIPDGYVVDNIESYYNQNFVVEYANDYLYVKLVFDTLLNCNYEYTVLDKCDFMTNNMIIPKNYNHLTFCSESLDGLNNIDNLDVSNVEGDIYLDMSDIENVLNIGKLILPNINKNRSVEIKLSEYIKINEIEINNDRVNMLGDCTNSMFKINNNYFIDSIFMIGEYCIIILSYDNSNSYHSILITPEKEIVTFYDKRIDDKEKLLEALKKSNDLNNDNLLNNIIKSRNIPDKYIDDIKKIFSEYMNSSKNQNILIKKL